MAIYNGRILMRKGNEADFDASKLMSGEWAVSLDAGIVRICLEAGKVIRMATYEAFEEDMKQIEAILLECQTIEEAVQRINTEINTKVDAVVEYVGQAKTYRDEAKTFRDEAEAFKNQAGEIAGIDIATTEKAGIVKPDGETLEVDADGTMRVIGGGGVSDYSELENKPSINGTELNGDMSLNDLGIASATELEKTNIKVDTIIEKADLGIKETASGKEIHLTDSAEGKAVEFALFGKARQDGEPTPENPIEIEVSGASYNLLENIAESKTLNGIIFTVNEDKSIHVSGTASANTSIELISGNVVLEESGLLSGVSGGSANTYNIQARNDTTSKWFNNYSGDTELASGTYNRVIIQIISGETVNTTFHPMIRKASVKNDRYMPYGKGSVEVKSCGKNLFDKNAVTSDYYLTSDGNTVVGTSWNLSDYVSVSPNTSYILSGGTNKGVNTSVCCYDKNQNYISGIPYQQNNTVLITTSSDTKYIRASIDDAVIDTFQIEKGTVATEYQPYKKTTATITTDGLAGIKVSSNGNYTDQNGQQWICDEIVKYADGSGEYVQRVGKTVFDDTVTFYKNEAIFNTKVATDRSTTNKIAMCTNHINVADSKINNLATANEYLKDGEFALRNSGVQDFYTVYFKNSLIETAEDFKAMMLSAELYYELAEPIRTPLTAEELAEISTFYPVTNISNDFDCGMRVKYNCDSKNYIDNKITLLTTAMVNSI